MTEVMTFADALGRSDPGKRKLLLGNGFSIAWRATAFTYRSLLEAADLPRLPRAKAVFDALGTSDFEEVIRSLLSAARITPAFGSAGAAMAEEMREDAEALKGILVEAIASRHPDRPQAVGDAAFAACRAFLRHFGCYYTLNYDLLLYWALMHDEADGAVLPRNDGFVHPDGEGETEYVVWEGGGDQDVHFLHGALHLLDAGAELQKRTWIRTSVPLMDQVREALDQERYPLFVAEGESRQKLSRIQHHGYLSRALRSFGSIGGDLFIYGHSLAPNDEHVLRKIERGKVKRLFVSLYGDPSSPDNVRIIRRAMEMSERRGGRKPLEVQFYDAASAQVWG
ncbi:DUF4917 family protein (plasmid) [Roseomonas sp. OT10]|uniref:DUF4917 family protein n=1 Tax=Roseomonas cutis TaxID=2897332 RepID=UPI001E44373D|nr:DUF4917 family protein [Roseomonas sp. OT10]UFN51588.1 DUF4917 family protein [Roseomonas sp. OT10]